MKKEINLIKESIKKWDKIIDGSGYDHGIINCPLCQEYYGNNECEECPVSLYVSNSCCEDTPYLDWNAYCQDRTTWPYKIFDDYSKELATYERDFLIKVLEYYEEEYENEM